ncbi:winged helix-turn-helix domain-containing protein [Ruminococcus sp. 5_1_39BFAA]|uniref:winged helix-turn-helix domain-containing protein n=1 Tax=Ruminococcus sp. 5_1_39BFAA TaxID=457412 RepID=UPI0035625C33
MNDIVNVLMVEAEKPLLQEVVALLSDNIQCHVTEVSLSGKKGNILTFPNLEIRINEQAVYHNGIPVPLTHHEFFTLLYLAQHPSWVLSKEQIYEAVWKADPEHCGAAVANVVYSLRRRIGDAYIETVVGSGYKFQIV